MDIIFKEDGSINLKRTIFLRMSKGDMPSGKELQSEFYRELGSRGIPTRGFYYSKVRDYRSMAIKLERRGKGQA